MNEKQLITLVQNGETSAYEQLVERYQTGLIIYCENAVKDRDRAEDIAQDAFIRAYYSLSKYDDTKGSFSTWLYRIAANRIKDHYRTHRRHTDIADLEELPSEAPTLSLSERNEIRAAVSSLQPPEYARVIAAYFWEGKRYEEIADELHVPVGTIGTWLTRAKKQLRKELS